MTLSPRFFAGIFLTALLIATVGIGQAHATREAHTFKLYKGSKHIYTRYYDIRLSHEGLIKATITIDDFGASGVDGAVVLWICPKKSPTKVAKCRAYEEFSKPGTYIVSTPVDSILLDRTHSYRIILSNVMNIPVRGKLVIEYPGRNTSGQAGSSGQGQAHKKCDLAVTGLSLAGDGRVMVDLKNNGPGKVPNQAWTSNKSVSVMLFREGKRWGGASIKVIDPQRYLQHPGGTATFVSNLKVSGSEKITAVVDYGNRVGETNKVNNGKSVTLGMQAIQPIKIQPRTFKR